MFVLEAPAALPTPQILKPVCLQSESVYENPYSLSTHNLKIYELIIQDVNVTVGVLFTPVQPVDFYSSLQELG